jgi:general secretion pathway protein D
MLIDSGQIAVIGGLTIESESESESETEMETRVPLLGEIPILGRLFRHDAKSHEQRSLLVFLRPTVVRSDRERESLLRRELNTRRDGLQHELQGLIGPEGAEETL